MLASALITLAPPTPAVFALFDAVRPHPDPSGEDDRPERRVVLTETGAMIDAFATMLDLLATDLKNLSRRTHMARQATPVQRS